MYLFYSKEQILFRYLKIYVLGAGKGLPPLAEEGRGEVIINKLILYNLELS
jgi:hypothetical protein